MLSWLGGGSSGNEKSLPTAESVIEAIVPQFIRVVPPKAESSFKSKLEVMADLDRKKDKLVEQLRESFAGSTAVDNDTAEQLCAALDKELCMVIVAYMKPITDAATSLAKARFLPLPCRGTRVARASADKPFHAPPPLSRIRPARKNSSPPTCGTWGPRCRCVPTPSPSTPHPVSPDPLAHPLCPGWLPGAFRRRPGRAAGEAAACGVCATHAGDDTSPSPNAPCLRRRWSHVNPSLVAQSMEKYHFSWYLDNNVSFDADMEVRDCCVYVEQGSDMLHDRTHILTHNDHT